jgi:transposase
LEKKRFRPSEQARPKVQEQRATFCRALSQIPLDRLIVLDESGCNLAMSLAYGRALRGARVYDHKPANWGENLSVIGAVRSDRVLCHQIFVGAVNGPRFVEFVRDTLAPRLYPGDVVVLDNLRAHHAPIVRDLVHAVGATLLFLPPYSPDLSPIEPCWGFVKHHLRRLAHRTTETLRRAIPNVLKRVRTKHLANWFTHCGYPQSERSPV